MPTNNIIFVGGIHGTGKTVFAQEICAITSLDHRSASSLIGAYKNKQVKNVPQNQEILIQAIQSELKKSVNYLMDGHFCLLNSDNEVEEIHLGVFRQIGLAGIFILHADIALIKKRLKDRDQKEYSCDLLAGFQKAELAHGTQVAQSLNLPLRIVSSTHDFNLPEHVHFVQEILQ